MNIYELVAKKGVQLPYAGAQKQRLLQKDCKQGFFRNFLKKKQGRVNT